MAVFAASCVVLCRARPCRGHESQHRCHWQPGGVAGRHRRHRCAGVARSQRQRRAPQRLRAGFLAGAGAAVAAGEPLHIPVSLFSRHDLFASGAGAGAGIGPARGAPAPLALPRIGRRGRCVLCCVLSASQRHGCARRMAAVAAMAAHLGGGSKKPFPHGRGNGFFYDDLLRCFVQGGGHREAVQPAHIVQLLPAKGKLLAQLVV